MLRQTRAASLLVMMIALLASKSYAQPDSSKSWWPSFIGGDLFASGEIYGLHLADDGYTTTSGGLGAEVRIHPLFVGAMFGNCGDEGLPYIHPAGEFPFYSIYAGVIVNHYRIEIGKIHADNTPWITKPPHTDYTVGFLGFSRRWGDIPFFEPGVKLIFPIVADTYRYTNFLPLEWVPVKEHFHFKDLYFAFSLKLGFGFN